MWSVVLISLALVISAIGEEYRYVNTLNGEVRAKATFNNITFEANIYPFLGIPYAKPPLGELRFQKPQPAEPWEGTLEADELPSACPQYSSYPYPWYDQNPDGKSEDCLYLNVYTPDDNSILRPVIVFIHGGGFQVGSSRMHNYNGKVIATNLLPPGEGSGDYLYQPGIVVTFNYRLGALGFLTTGTDDAPGNAGFRDMIMALNWVKANIKAFGGDPELITLLGQGAGAIAISLILTMPSTKGLFQRAILNSGTFTSHKENSFEKNLMVSQRLAEAVGCTSEDMTFNDHPKEVVTCLQGIDANELAVTLNSLDPEDLMMFYPEYDGDLLPSDPERSLLDRKVHDIPILMGASVDEGSYLLTTMYPEVLGRFGEKEQGLNLTFAESVLREIFKSYPEPEKVVRYYLEGVDESDENDIRRRTYYALGDERIICPSEYFGQVYGNGFRKVHYFTFDYQLSPHMPWAKWMKSVHYNDVPYLLGMAMEVSGDEPTPQNGLIFFIRVQTVLFAINGNVEDPDWRGHEYRGDFLLYLQMSDYMSIDTPGSSKTSRCRYLEYFRDY